MREELARMSGQKSVFTATYKRHGWQRFMGRVVAKTLLLVDVKDKGGKVVTDHLWCKMGKRFDKLGLEPGDVLQFHARVGTYSKHRGEDFDYHLEYPMNIGSIFIGV